MTDEKQLGQTDVWLIRHGETEWSTLGRHTGLTDLPLTPKGEREAASLRDRLAAVPFDLVLSSPLRRAHHTAELAGFGDAEVVGDLVEWNYGDYEGKTSAEIRAGNPGWNLFRDGCPGGESPAAVAQRADRLAAKLKALTGNMLCVAHGHILRVLGARWVGAPVTFAGCLLLGTAALCILSFDHGEPDEPAIKLWNSTEY